MSVSRILLGDHPTPTFILLIIKIRERDVFLFLMLTLGYFLITEGGRAGLGGRQKIYVKAPRFVEHRRFKGENFQHLGSILLSAIFKLLREMHTEFVK